MPDMSAAELYRTTCLTKREADAVAAVCENASETVKTAAQQLIYAGFEGERIVEAVVILKNLSV